MIEVDLGGMTERLRGATCNVGRAGEGRGGGWYYYIF